jgi:hypothetical protein
MPVRTSVIETSNDGGRERVVAPITNNARGQKPCARAGGQAGERAGWQQSAGERWKAAP